MADAFQTPYVRLAFPKLTDSTAEDKANGKKKYACAIYIPKDEKAYDSLKTDGREAALTPMIPKLLEQSKKFVKDMQGLAKKLDPKGAAKLFKDGDKKADEKAGDWELENPDKPMPSYVESTRGFWILNVSTEYKPNFFGPKASEAAKDDAWAEQELYGGAWVRMDVRSPYKWTFQGKKGVSIGLGGKVQKWQDAESFSSGSSETKLEDCDELVPTLSDDDTID